MAAVAAPPPFDYSALKSPHKDTIREVAKQLNTKLFERPDCRHHYKIEDIAKLLNKLSECDHAPNPTQLPWGDALLGIISLQQCMHFIGTRGTNEQQNTKKAVLAMLAYKSPTTNKLINRDLLNAMTAHDTKHGRAAYVNKGLKRRDDFDSNDDAIKLCHDVQRKKREGMCFK